MKMQTGTAGTSVPVASAQVRQLPDRRMAGRDVCLKAIGVIAVLLAVAVLLFSLFPRLDLAVDQMFSSAAVPFPAKDMLVWSIVRAVMISATDGLMIAVILWMGLACILPRLRIVRQRVLGFMVMVYIAIPGLLVNGVLKPHWGRARPRNLLDFGGTAQFSPPLEIADQCGGSCSFVSGEASALFTVATLFILIFIPLLSPRMRTRGMILIGAVAVLGSALRVVVGAHFVSDVVFAALLATVVTLMLYLLAGMDRVGSPFVAQHRPAPQADQDHAGNHHAALD